MRLPREEKTSYIDCRVYITSNFVFNLPLLVSGDPLMSI